VALLELQHARQFAQRRSPRSMPPSSCRRHISLLLLALLLCIGIVEYHAAEAARVADVAVDQLPSVFCRGPVHEMYGAGAKFVINGTTAVTMPEIAPGVYDESNKIAFFLKNLTEQLRNPIPDFACRVSNPILNSLDLNDCDCEMVPYSLQDPSPIPVWKDEGVRLNFTSCKGHADLHIAYTLSIPSAEHSDYYDNLRAGSTVSNFSYVHPYVPTDDSR